MNEEIELNPAEKWLVEINEKAESVAKELSILFDCEVKPSVFILKPLEDAAIAYIKIPDARTSLKILRTIGENYEMGLELAVKGQVIRQADLIQKQIEGEASDLRFMDVNGNYDKKHSQLNFSLLLAVKDTLTVFQDMFKKKI